LTGFGLSFAFAYMGQKLAPATDVALIVVAEPIMIIAWARLVTGQPAPPRLVPAATLAFAGVALIAFQGQPPPTTLAAHLTGDGLVLLGAAVQGWYTVYGERMARRIPAVPLTWATIGYGSITLLPGAIYEFSRGGVAPLGVAAWLAVLYLAIGCTAVGYLAWFILLHRADSRILGMSMYLQPVVGIASAAVFLGEPVTWRTFGGAALIVAAVTAASVSPGSMETDAIEPEAEATRKLSL
jgi:drug/metabolite transporter (DMT)-like permease